MKHVCGKAIRIFLPDIPRRVPGITLGFNCRDYSGVPKRSCAHSTIEREREREREREFTGTTLAGFHSALLKYTSGGTASTLVVLSLPLARRYLAMARNPVESYHGRCLSADPRAGFVSSRACRGIGNDSA